ncbi:MAG: hypothetical protein AAF401_04200 [Pseudomonadota bacterium]
MRKFIFIIAALMAAAPSAALAVVVSYDFTGVFTATPTNGNVSNIPDTFGSIVPGVTPFSGSFVYETNQAPASTNNTFNTYTAGPHSVSLFTPFGDVTVSESQLGANLTVQDNLFSDTFRFVGSNPSDLTFGAPLNELSLFLISDVDGLFNLNGLPGDDLSFSQFTNTFLRIGISDPDDGASSGVRFAFGELTSFSATAEVPLPAPALMLLAAMMGLGVWRRYPVLR